MNRLRVPDPPMKSPPPPPGPRPMTADGVHEAAAALLFQHLLPPARCLDLAAGQGAFSRRLHQAGYRVVAADVEPSGWQVPEVPLRLVDLDQPFADQLAPAGFDACVAIEILEHVHDPTSFLRQCQRLLRPGGLLLLSSPNVESLASRLLFLWNGRLRFFTADETHHITPIFSWSLQRSLADAGFERLAVTYNRHTQDCGQSWKARLASQILRGLTPLWPGDPGDKGGEIRLVLARALPG